MIRSSRLIRRARKSPLWTTSQGKSCNLWTRSGCHQMKKLHKSKTSTWCWLPKRTKTSHINSGMSSRGQGRCTCKGLTDVISDRNFRASLRGRTNLDQRWSPPWLQICKRDNSTREYCQQHKKQMHQRLIKARREHRLRQESSPGSAWLQRKSWRSLKSITPGWKNKYKTPLPSHGESLLNTVLRTETSITSLQTNTTLRVPSSVLRPPLHNFARWWITKKTCSTSTLTRAGAKHMLK